MLTRKLIYTAITQASRSLILLGEKEALEEGIQTDERHERKTTLKKRILQE
jgi:ATP-dependent exoDNAse (exonuclease V) alpha subunit